MHTILDIEISFDFYRKYKILHQHNLVSAAVQYLNKKIWLVEIIYIFGTFSRS